MNTEENNTQLPQSSVSVSVTELRIGNLILDKDNEINEVVGIVNGAIFLKNKYEFVGCPASWCKPIRFNEDFLKRYNFNFDDMKDTNDDNTWYHLTYGGYKFSSDQSCEFESVFVMLNKRNIELKYVHKFQNMYNELTNGSSLQSISLTEH